MQTLVVWFCPVNCVDELAEATPDSLPLKGHVAAETEKRK